MLNCECCTELFETEEKMIRHHKMRFRQAFEKFRQYLVELNYDENICDCNNCKDNFPPNKDNNPYNKYKTCKLRDICINILRDMVGIFDWNKANDIQTDLLYIMVAFESDTFLTNKFIIGMDKLNDKYSKYKRYYAI